MGNVQRTRVQTVVDVLTCTYARTAVARNAVGNVVAIFQITASKQTETYAR